MSSKPSLSQPILTDDIGVNTFINRANSTLSPGQSVFDKFLKTYSFIDPLKNQLTNALKTYPQSYTVKMNSSGSLIIRQIAPSTLSPDITWINPLIPTSTISFSDSGLTTLQPLSSTQNNGYWLSSNKYWILYFNGNSFAMYYNPIYRPAFIDFSAFNPLENVIPYFTEYCRILSSSNNLTGDANCQNPLDLPQDLKNYTRRIGIQNSSTTTPTNLPTIAPGINPETPRKVDSIKLSKSGTSVGMNILNIVIIDYEGNDIIANLPQSAKSINVTNANNPYLYIYFGDYFVKEVIIEGNATINNLNNTIVQLLDNTTLIYNTTLTNTPTQVSTPTFNNYIKPSFAWDVSTKTVINDAIVSKVEVFSTRETSIKISKIRVFNKNNINLALSPVANGYGLINNTVTNNLNELMSTDLQKITTSDSSTNTYLGIDLKQNSTLLNNLGQIIIVNTDLNLDKLYIQDDVIRLRDRNNNIIVDTLKLPGGADTYTFDMINRSLSFSPDNTLIAKRVVIEKPFGSFNVTVKPMGSPVNITIISEDGTGSSGAGKIGSFETTIRDNVRTGRGDYVYMVDLTFTNSGMDNMAGCVIKLLEGDNILAMSDIISNVPQTSVVRWFVKENRLEYIKSDGAITRDKLPKPVYNGTESKPSRFGSRTDWSNTVICPLGQVLTDYMNVYNNAAEFDNIYDYQCSLPDTNNSYERIGLNNQQFGGGWLYGAVKSKNGFNKITSSENNSSNRVFGLTFYDVKGDVGKIGASVFTTNTEVNCGNGRVVGWNAVRGNDLDSIEFICRQPNFVFE